MCYEAKKMLKNYQLMTESRECNTVAMGCFNGTEICELVGIYIQCKLSNIMNKDDLRSQDLK